MKIHDDIKQNSMEWLDRRAGVCTASEFDELMTPKFKARDGKMVESYLCRKLAERWMGPLPSFNTLDMSFGQIKEEMAIPFYETVFDEPIQQAALITNDEGTIGCSPDGLIASDGGIEIKCPRAETHCKYLLAEELPDEYVLQVHGSLYVTGRAWWKFMSYHPKFPPFVTTIYRDEKICSFIGETLAGFIPMLDAAFKKLVEKNGGLPKRFAPEPPPQPPSAQSDDLQP